MMLFGWRWAPRRDSSTSAFGDLNLRRFDRGCTSITPMAISDGAPDR
jgi:hypothetical protein